MQTIQVPTYTMVYLGRDASLSKVPFSDTSLSNVRTPSAMRLLSLGVARKASLPMIALSAVGWILFIVGFAKYRNRYLYVGSVQDYPELYWAWAASTMGPVVYMLAGIHAVVWKRSSGVVWRRISAAIGSTTALLGVVYTSSLGYALIACGVFTYESTKYLYSDNPWYGQYPDYMGLMLAGSFLACLFWAITVALWPWYTNHHTADSDHIPLYIQGYSENAQVKVEI